MTYGEIHKNEAPTAAFVLSLLSGLWMLAAGGMMGGYRAGGMMGGYGWGRMMGGWPGMHSWMWSQGTRGFGMWWTWFGVLAGIIVLVGAVMLYSKSEQHRTWGIVILVASALSLFVGMGNLVAGMLGVIGGILAVVAKE